MRRGRDGRRLSLPRAVGRKPPLERPLRTEVRPGCVFLLSDNRSYHDDSRDFGVQPRDVVQAADRVPALGQGGVGDEERRLSIVR